LFLASVLFFIIDKEEIKFLINKFKVRKNWSDKDARESSDLDKKAWWKI
jgi:hypothetical protein